MVWIWIGAFIANLFLSFIPASMARNKGHSFGGYWALSTFLVGWLIGIIIAACLSNRLLKQGNNVVQTNVNVQNTTLPPVYDAASQPNYSNPPQNAGSKYCGNCGAQINTNAKFCNSCGIKAP